MLTNVYTKLCKWSSDDPSFCLEKTMKVFPLAVCFFRLLSLAVSIELPKENQLVYYDETKKEFAQMSLDFTNEKPIFKPVEIPQNVVVMKVKQTKEHTLLYWLESEGTVIKKTRIPITSGTAVTEDAFRSSTPIKSFDVHPTLDYIYLGNKHGLRIREGSEDPTIISNGNVLSMKYNLKNNHLYVKIDDQGKVILEDYDLNSKKMIKGFTFTFLTSDTLWDTDGDFLYFIKNKKLYKIKLPTEGETNNIPIENATPIEIGQKTEIVQIILGKEFLYLISVNMEGKREISKVNVAPGKEKEGEVKVLKMASALAILETKEDKKDDDKNGNGKDGSSSAGSFEASLASLFFMIFSALFNL